MIASEEEKGETPEMKKNAIACGLMLVVAFALSAQSKKGGILQPQMTVETGSYDKPAGKLGRRELSRRTARPAIHLRR